MSIVDAGFDVRRRQITFDALDTETGEVLTGRTASTPEAVAAWVERFPGKDVHVAVEACTGWYFVCRALQRAGAVLHLAEVAGSRALRGRKRRAKTDRADARWLRTLLSQGRLPEAWIPPDHICWLRMRTGCARRWSTSRPRGASASRRRSSTSACRRCPTAPAVTAPAGAWRSSSCRRPRASGSRSVFR